MRKLLLALMISLLATAAATGEEWAYEGGGVPIAYVDNGAAQLQFACRGGDLTMGFWVRAPHRQVAAASAMHLALTPDPKGSTDGSAGTSFVQDFPLIHAEGTSMIVRGPVARSWAGIAQRAKSALRLAYVQKDAGGGMQFFDRQEFGARGSSAAIRKVLERCG